MFNSNGTRIKMATNKSLWTKGLIYNTPFVCQHSEITYNTITNDEYRPFDYTTPTTLIHLILILVVSRVTYFFLRFLGQNLLIAQIVTGILIGPSFLTHDRAIRDKLFPPGGTVILKTLGYFGLMIHLFGLGVNSSTTLFKSLRTKIVLVGLSSFFSGIVASFSTLSILQRTYKTVFNRSPIGFPIILAFNSVSPYIVVTSLLIELKMINSELGNLASSVSLVTDVCGCLAAGFAGNVTKAVQNQDFRQASITFLCILGYYLTIIFILRPLVICIANCTPEGRPMSETHFFAIIIIVLGVGFCGEVIGQTSALPVFIFGLTLPDGPPLGMTLIEKFDTFTSGILFPVFCTISGLRTNLHSLNRVSSPLIESVLLMGYLGKFLGTLMSTILLGEMSLNGALPLALILWCKGVIELAAYGFYKDGRIISDEIFALAILTMLIITGISIQIIKHLYDPSLNYNSFGGQSIVNMDSKGVLKILVCIYNEENVPSMIKILQVPKPTKESPLRVFVLQLFDLVGHKQAVLAPYDKANKKVLTRTDSQHVVTAFEMLQKENLDNLRIQHFFAVTPYATMHNDICTIAYDRGVNIIILPFHKNEGIDNKMVEVSLTNIRSINRRVLKNAPCSVGILVNRSGLMHSSIATRINNGLSFSSVATLFLGGTDDHEALAYSKRMLDDSNVKLTIIRIKFKINNLLFERDNDTTLTSDDLVMANFFASTKSNSNNVKYKDFVVEDAVGTTKIICSIEDTVDLVLVGRYHDPRMPSISGLIDWSEWPELGAIGAMLTTWDFRCSVLVVQQPTPDISTFRRRNSLH